MFNKVQAKPHTSDTSIFHHNIINLLVVEELNKLKRIWPTFLFLIGYEFDVVTPRKTPKSKSSTLREDKKSEAEPVIDHEVEMEHIENPIEVEF